MISPEECLISLFNEFPNHHLIGITTPKEINTNDGNDFLRLPPTLDVFYSFSTEAIPQE